MAELLLVNPHRRKARKSRSRRRKSRPMPPALARWHAMHPHGAKRRRRRKTPTRQRARRRTHHGGRKDNPSFRGLGSGLSGRFIGSLKQGFVGAVGGLTNDLLMGQVLPRLPATLGSGFGAAAVKLAGAVVVASLGGMVWRGRGRDLGDGAMTVVLHDLLKAQVQPFLPAFLPMGEYMTFAPTVGYTGMGEYLTGHGSQMGEYITSDIGNPDFYGSHPAGMLN